MSKLTWNWRVCVFTDEIGNPLRVTLVRGPEDRARTIVEWICGPFDPAEDAVSEAMEMIQHYGWQETLPTGGRTSS
jgi:hypothetical protein